MRAFLFWLSGFLPYREISDGNVPYLERYYIGTLFGWRFYLHRFLGSDPERGLHDHPWRKAYSLILCGYYLEETRSGLRTVRRFNSLTGDTFHRVVHPGDHAAKVFGDCKAGRWCADNKKPIWTLFAHTAKDVKPWGFLQKLPVKDHPGAAVFDPYRYEREGSQKDWWLTAGRRQK